MKRIIHIALTIIVAAVLAVPAPVARAEALVVSAAASLTTAFKDIEPAFKAAHPGVDVVMNFASSGVLYRQIERGAPADVYASANPKWMQKAVKSGFVSGDAVKIFAHNVLVLAVPAGNPAGVKTLSDLTDNGVKRIGIGTPETVPAGQYAESALTAMGMYARLKPRFIFCETVRQVLDYLSRDEVDCGFVYRTDTVKAGDKVVIIQEISLEKPVTYPIAVLKESAVSNLAQLFVDFVTGSEGMILLEAQGFKRP